MQFIVPLLFLVGLLASNFVHAQSASYPVSTVRNVSTLGTGSVNPANVSRFAFAAATGGIVDATVLSTVPLAAGRNLPVTVVAQVPKATTAAALGRFVGRALPLLSTASALYQLGEELGFGLDPSGITRNDPSVCTVAPCYSWTWNGLPGVSYSTPEAMCGAIASNNNLTFRRFAPYSCYFGKPGDPEVSVSISRLTVNPSPPSTIPATPQDFADSINARTAWPADTKLPQALKDAIKDGESVLATPTSVSGPATTPGTSTVIVDNTNNTTTTTTTTNNHTYAGNKVTTNITTTSVTVNNSTGATISNTTTTEQPLLPETPQEEEEDTTFLNADLPPIPKLYDPEFPDGLEGVWNDRKAQLLDTSLFQLIPSLMPNMGDGGCPTWSIPSIYGGNLNASIPCSVWYFIRLVIIISALLLARRLIFGG